MSAARLARLAVLLNVVASAASGQTELQGTLFTSPEQRAYLDYLRQEFLSRSQERGFDISATTIPDIPLDGTEEAATPPQIYTLAGIVTLRDGTRRIWLNGQSLTEAQLPANARLVNEGGGLALRFSASSGSHLLKPGQTLELEAGRIAENFAWQPPAAPATDAVTADQVVATSDTPAEESGNAEQPARTTAGEPESALVPLDTEAGIPDMSEAVQQLSPEQAAELLQALQQLQSGSGDSDE